MSDMLASQALTLGRSNCWILTGQDGQPLSEDYVPHYKDRQEAEKAHADQYRWWSVAEDGPKPVELAQELERPCWTLVTLCGHVFDQDGDGGSHEPEEQPSALLAAAFANDLKVLPDGRMTCGPEPCEQCREALGSYPPPVVPIPGQLTIDGAEVEQGGQINLGQLRRLQP